MRQRNVERGRTAPSGGVCASAAIAQILEQLAAATCHAVTEVEHTELPTGFAQLLESHVCRDVLRWLRFEVWRPVVLHELLPLVEAERSQNEVLSFAPQRVFVVQLVQSV